MCSIRASIPSIVHAICCYILASNHKNDVLPGLPIVKIFKMLLQYHPIFKMVPQQDCIIKNYCLILLAPFLIISFHFLFLPSLLFCSLLFKPKTRGCPRVKFVPDSGPTRIVRVGENQHRNQPVLMVGQSGSGPSVFGFVLVGFGFRCQCRNFTGSGEI